MKAIYLSLLFVLLFNGLSPLYSQTPLSGNVDSDLTLVLVNSPYEISSDLIVNEGVTLSIEPGVEIQFPSTNRDIFVYGRLLAVGTSAAPIQFIGSNASATTHGGGLFFYNTSSGNILNHVKLEKLGDNSSYWDAAMYVDQADLSISNTEILDTESGTPMLVTPNSPGALTFTNNKIPYVVVRDGSVNTDMTWAVPDTAYILAGSGDIIVDAGVTLTLQAGTSIWMGSQNNNINVNGTLIAQGTAAKPIEIIGINTDENVHGGGVNFYSTSSGNILNHVKLEKLGDKSAYWDTPIYVDQAEVSISNTEIIDTESNWPMLVTPNSPGGLTFTNNKIPFVVVKNGLVSADATWAIPDTAYILEGTGDLTVDAGVILTLQAGTSIWMSSQYNDIDVNGTLVAQGTAAKPIEIVGINLDENVHGGGINFYHTSSGNILNHVKLEKLGDKSAYWDAAMYVDQAEVSISNTEILDTESGWPMLVTPNSPGTLTFTNNKIPYVVIRNGSVSVDATWAVPDTAYILEGTGNLTVDVGVILTLQAGTSIWMSSRYNDIDVNGTLIAQGTAAKPIEVIGINTDENVHGGGVNFYHTSSGNILNHVKLEKLGDKSGYWDAAIYVDQAEVSISNTEILDTESGWPMLVTPDSPGTLTFTNNKIPYVVVRNGSVSVDATWAVPDTAYILEGTGNLTVDVGVTLTLQAGTSIWMSSQHNDIDVNGTLIAQGTAAKPIEVIGINTDENVHGGGVNFYHTSSGNILNYVKLEKLGDKSAYWDAAMYVDQAEVSISNTEILDTESGWPMLVTPNSPGTLTFTNNKISYVVVRNGGVSTDITWAIPDTAYILEGTGNLIVNEGSTLTLQAGTSIWMSSQYNDIDVRGTLIAQGTAAKPIEVIGINTDENVHGGGVNFYSTSSGNILNHVKLEKLGDRSGYWDAAMYVDLAEVSISNSEIIDTESGGHIRATPNSPARISFQNNDIPYINIISGTVTESSQWGGSGINYLLEDDLAVEALDTLTLLPGTEIWFPYEYVNMWVSGVLLAEGTPAKPIRFWGNNIEPATYGGGLVFVTGSEGSRLSHTILERLAGMSYSPYSGIFVYNGADVSVTNSKIFDMEWIGMWLAETGNATIINNCIYQTGNHGVYKDGVETVNAQNNYWGDPSGPAPFGIGVQVSDNVLVDPWLTECESTTQKDIAAVQLISPNTGCELSDKVTVRIANVGLSDQSNFQIGYQINGGTPVYQTVNQNVNSGQTLDVEFNGTIDLANIGFYEFQIFTLLSGDEQTKNDTLTVNIEKFLPLDIEIMGSTTICAGEYTLLTIDYNPDYLYQWSDNSTSYYTYADPTQSTNYTVTVTNANYPSCVEVETVLVEVLPVPEIPLVFASSTTLCTGGTVTLTVNGLTDNLIWNTGQSGPEIIVNQAGWYQVTHVGDNGCSSISEWILINSEYIPYTYFGQDGVICGQETETICVWYGASYQWSTGETDACITVMPAVNTTYYVTVTNAGNCVHELEATVTVSSDAAPGGVSSMFPPDGAQNVSIPVPFSWSPGANATHYDIYIWQEGSSEPSFPTTTTTQIALTYYGNLQYGNTYNWKVCARNDCSTDPAVCSDTQQFSLNELPDLVVPKIYAPATGFSGAEIEISWEVRNNGTGGTNEVSNNGYWYDACYLSPDSILGGNDIFVGNVVNAKALISGETYTSPSLTATLPNGFAGRYFVIVCTDNYGYMPEADEQNNCRIEPIPVEVLLSPYPDLRVSALPLPTGAAGGVVSAGASYEVQWTVENRNNSSSSGPTLSEWWYDRVYLSADTFLNLQTAQLQATIRHDSNLEIGGNYTASANIDIPANGSDTLYVFVTTDVTDREYEYIFENNNRRRSAPLRVISIPKPDFVPENIATVDTASNKENITIDWSVSNQGASYSGGGITDRIFISTQPDFSGTARQLGSFYQTLSDFDNGDNYTAQRTVQVPGDLTGKYYLLVLTNGYNSIEELDATNNVIVDSIVILSPNLIVSNITPMADATSGETVTFEWELSNIGEGDLLGYNVLDEIKLLRVSNPSNAITLPLKNGNTTIFSGGTQTRQQTYTLPVGLTGDFYIRVHTNVYESAYENGLISDNVNQSTAIFHIEAADYPNLVAKSIASSATTATAGDMITIDFSVKNEGDAPTTGNWTDRIYLSTDPTWPLNNSITLKSISQSQVVAIDSSYEKTATVQLSTNLQAGNYYLYLYTDIGGSIFENNLENDNRVRSISPVDISIYPLVDLAFTDQPIGPTTLSPGETASVYYKVSNNGTVATPTDLWKDALYLSPNPSWDPSDVLIAEWQRNGAVNAGEGYEKLENFTLPDGFSDAFYLCLVIDHENAVAEANENNNSVKILQSNGDPIVVVYPPKPDLEISNFDVPATVIAGQPITVEYTVQNSDDDGAAVTDWAEAIYLSTDENLDGGDIYLAQKNHTDDLAAGAAYSDQMEITIPLGISDNYFLLIKTDARNALAEEVETNNVESQYVFINQPPPADLFVLMDEIEVPVRDTITTEITISWTVKNIGQNPLSGYMIEGVYLSEDPIWDAMDVQLGTWSGTLGLDPNTSAHHTLTARLENVKRQAYYVFIKTDLLDHFLEADENNNCSLGPTTVFVEVPELPIGLPATPASLAKESPIYYRIEIPTDTVGETMRVRLTGISDPNAFNELYLRRNDIPSRTLHDYSFASPFEENQEIIIPVLGAGTYYLMAYAAIGEPVQEIELVAEIIPFQINSITANKGGNTGSVTALITGAKFTEDMMVSLERSGSPAIVAEAISLTNSSRAFVTFPLRDVDIGLYDVVAVEGSDEDRIVEGFEVVTGSISVTPLLTCSIDLGNQVIPVPNIPDSVNVLFFEPQHPPVVRPNQIFPITLRYENTGDVDLPVPSRIFASVNGFPVSIDNQNINEDQEELPITFTEEDGPKNVLRPGGVAFVKVYSKATRSEGVLKFKLFSN